jgi:hypothetical protein
VRQCVRISGIPSHFTIADIRAFFLEVCTVATFSFDLFPSSCFFSPAAFSFVESGKFEQFHIRSLPRIPPSRTSPPVPSHIAVRTGLYTPINRRPPLPAEAVAVFASSSSAAAFSRSFQGKKWAALSCAPQATTGRCVVERVAINSGINAGRQRQGILASQSKKESAACPAEPPVPCISGVEGCNCGEAVAEATPSSSIPCLPLVDLLPPPASLPRGNIGTPTSELLSLVSRCVLPCAALKQMGLQHFAGGGIGRKFKDFNFKWPQSKAQGSSVVSGRDACSDEGDDDADGDGLETSWGGGARNYTRRDRMDVPCVRSRLKLKRLKAKRQLS